MKIPRSFVFAAAIVLFAPVQAEDGFVPLFDGKTLKGLHVSAKTGHSVASKNATGGKWVVQDGVLVGSQDFPGSTELE